MDLHFDGFTSFHTFSLSCISFSLISEHNLQFRVLSMTKDIYIFDDSCEFPGPQIGLDNATIEQATGELRILVMMGLLANQTPITIISGTATVV